MIDTSYIERIKRIAERHLNCILDTKKPDFVPEDLNEGTYRWYLYFYSNMYKEGNDYINTADKIMFIDIFKRLRDEHTISWTRDTLLQLDKKRLKSLQKCILLNIRKTKSFYELKANLYLYRMINKGRFIADPFIIRVSESIKEFVYDRSTRDR